MKRKLIEFLGAVVIASVVFVACHPEEEIIYSSQEISALTDGTEQSPEMDSVVVEQESENVCIHVCGAVMKPGVYELPEGSRLYEVTSMAGGLLPDADSDGINLAREIRDGEQVRIPFIGEETKEDGLVNINIADEDGLCEIPGVGVSKAQAIISYRNENGPFQTIDGLMQVAGIKNGLLEQMRPYIKCE